MIRAIFPLFLAFLLKLCGRSGQSPAELSRLSVWAGRGAVVALLCLIGSAHAAVVTVVLSDSSPSYQEFADAVRAELRRDNSGHEVVVLDSDQAAPRALPDSALIIGVGSRAAQMLATRELKAPLLLALLPRSAYERIVAGRKDDKRVSSVFIDQPANRHIELLRVALPEVDRVGMLVGSDSKDTAARLAQAARERRLKVMQESVGTEGDLFPALQKLLSEGGVLLATPDATVFSSHTIPNILLTAYRHRVPVIGFSQAYVRAGALIAIYSTPAQIGTQSAEIARSVIAGGALPAPQYPRLFSVGVNTHVARSLGLEMESESAIQEKLGKLERPQ